MVYIIKKTINRCSFIDRTKGLVSRGCAVFNGLIRDQAKLCKITAALQKIELKVIFINEKYLRRQNQKKPPKITEETFFFSSKLHINKIHKYQV